MISPLRLFASLVLTTASLFAAKATGTFIVKMTPTAPSTEDHSGVGQIRLFKTYAGDMIGTGAGHMLMVRTATKGSAGYVALEKIEATLAGKSGTFLLQHHGIMDRGNPSLSVSVVPDSGDGDLLGISGTLKIEVADGDHHYVFDYLLPSPH